MNLKIQYFKIPTEFEFARKFYLKGLNLENENLENKSNVKKSNLRDYDENPLIIVDNTKKVIRNSIILIICLICLAVIKDFFFDGKINSMQIAMCFTFVILFRRAEAKLYKNAIVYFYNDKIIKVVDDKIFAEFEPKSIKKITKTISYSLPIFYPTPNDFTTKSAVVFLIILPILGLFMFPMATIMIVVLTFLVLILPQVIFHFGENTEILHDMIFIQSKNGLFFNFLLSSQDDYNELKTYFKLKANKNLDIAEKKISVWFDISEKDIKIQKQFILQGVKYE